jgi:hypothetical protein
MEPTRSVGQKHSMTLKVYGKALLSNLDFGYYSVFPQCVCFPYQVFKISYITRTVLGT